MGMARKLLRAGHKLAVYIASTMVKPKTRRGAQAVWSRPAAAA
jgi:3-hydroxyisobutyrate dehydrogenase-like beta-hydroxyacid dehydrogenase